MGGSDHEKGREVPTDGEDDSDHGAKSSYATEEDEEFVQMGPKCSIKEHLEMDKDDESLRRWKEQLLGSVEINPEAQEPDVKVLSLTIISAGRGDIALQIPENGRNPEGLWFTLKEGSKYRLRFAIKVSNEIVCGLKYINYVWKTGIKVDSSKEMLGTFSPQVEPYIHEMPEETTPSGMLARGTYCARTKFIDDDKKVYLDITYTFDIQKEWAETS
nr:rho GDP-dissociation inhibitor 1-like [Ipomoea batatas]GME17701.1 rho GDP-dissociation inhibitor 1-like [Ipomoea batatas]